MSSLCELAGSFVVTTKTKDDPVGISLAYDTAGNIVSKVCDETMAVARMNGWCCQRAVLTVCVDAADDGLSPHRTAAPARSRQWHARPARPS